MQPGAGTRYSVISRRRPRWFRLLGSRWVLSRSAFRTACTDDFPSCTKSCYGSGEGPSPSGCLQGLGSDGLGQCLDIPAKRQSGWEGGHQNGVTRL